MELAANQQSIIFFYRVCHSVSAIGTRLLCGWISAIKNTLLMTYYEISKKEVVEINRNKQEQDAHQMVGQAKRRAAKIRPKAIGWRRNFRPFSELRQMPI